MAVIPIRAQSISERLDRIAKRLVTLLRESEDPNAEMSDVLSILEEHGLWNGSMDPARIDRGVPKFYGFAQNAIVENELVRDALEQSDREFEPIYCESVEELISELLPRD